MAKNILDPLGWKGYFERFALPLLQRDRWFIGMLLALGVAFAEAAALATLVPLHTVVPYVVETNALGEVINSGRVLPTGDPSSAQITYWVGQFFKDLYTVSPVSNKKDVSQGFYMTEGPAVAQYSRFMKKHNPITLISDNPSLRVTVHIDGVSTVNSDTVYVTGTKTNQLTGQTTQINATITYATSPPKTVKQALINPIGLKVTNFVTGE